MLKVLDLFSGIGGFSLGLERTGGFETVAFCEIEEFPRRVLAKHWPKVPIYNDVRTLTAERLAADGIGVDVICGGFPCQDISLAGKGAGLEGERSGLWSEIARLAGELRPGYLIVENVSALLSRGLGTVLGDLAALGFDAEWHCIPASAIGAPHRRDRFWLVAYPQRQRPPARAPNGLRQGAVSDCDGLDQRSPTGRTVFKSGAAGGREDVADADQSRLEGRLREVLLERARQRAAGPRGALLHADSARPHAGAQPGIHRSEEGAGARYGQSERSDWWLSEPNVGRVANGVPSRVDRLKALGNAVVPQIPEIIGRAILAAEAERQKAAA